MRANRVLTNVRGVMQPMTGVRSIAANTCSVDIFQRHVEKTGNIPQNQNLRHHINELYQAHSPSKHPFFNALTNAPHHVINNEGWLTEFYTRYQSAMHCVRVSKYKIPYFNIPSLQQHKELIISNNTIQHQNLEDMFERFGAKIPSENKFGELVPLAKRLDNGTANFVLTVNKLYRRSVGAWFIADILLHNSLFSLGPALRVHFPFAYKEPYFDRVFGRDANPQCATGNIILMEKILFHNPHMEKVTINHAQIMAKEIDGLWHNLHCLVKYPIHYMN